MADPFVHHELGLQVSLLNISSLQDVIFAVGIYFNISLHEFIFRVGISLGQSPHLVEA
jgi:hypothetical protein